MRLFFITTSDEVLPQREKDETNLISLLDSHYPGMLTLLPDVHLQVDQCEN